MNKILIITLSALVAVFSVNALAYSYMGFDNEYGYGQNSMMRNYAQDTNTALRNDLHTEVSNVFVNGTYTDLVNLREKYNMPIMRWVDSEEDFKLAKQEFVLKEEYYTNNSDTNRGVKGRRGCPMRSNYY